MEGCGNGSWPGSSLTAKSGFLGHHVDLQNNHSYSVVMASTEIVLSITDTSALPTRVVADDRDEQFRQAVAGWLLERPSENTRTAYSKDLTRFCSYFTARGTHPLDATRPEIAEWAEAMRRGIDVKPNGRKSSESTIARRLSVVSSFFTYAVSVELSPANPVKDMRRPKRVVDEDGIVFLNGDADAGRPDEMKAFLTAAAKRKGYQAARDHALLAVMLTTGARTTEVLGADVSDLGYVKAHRVLFVIRKGGKRQSLIVAPWVGELIDAYLDGRTEGPLFATKARGGGHGRMDEPALLRMIQRVGKAAGLPNAEQLHPHSLRHSALTAAFSAGGSLVDVQLMAGHADPRTTERYLHIGERLDSSPIHALAAKLAG